VASASLGRALNSRLSGTDELPLKNVNNLRGSAPHPGVHQTHARAGRRLGLYYTNASQPLRATARAASRRPGGKIYECSSPHYPLIPAGTRGSAENNAKRAWPESRKRNYRDSELVTMSERALLRDNLNTLGRSFRLTHPMMEFDTTSRSAWRRTCAASGATACGSHAAAASL
jgi:hypothetical protein